MSNSSRPVLILDFINASCDKLSNHARHKVPSHPSDQLTFFGDLTRIVDPITVVANPSVDAKNHKSLYH